MKYKLCSTAVGLMLASSIPAFAQTDATPPGTIALTFEGDGVVYAVPYATAAELCDVSPTYFTRLAENPNTRVIYCNDVDDAQFATLIDQGTVTPLVDFEDADDDDDDGDSGDDAEETAADEANDADGDGILDEDDNDVDDEDGLIDDDSAGVEDETDDTTDDTTDETEADAEGDANVEADAEAEAN